MLRIARSLSHCEADAHDAVQAAAERFLRHHDRLDDEVAGWLATVTRREALRVRQGRGRTTALDDVIAIVEDDGAGPDEVAARREEVAVARELIGQLKPAERQALWLQAEGLSYREIADQLDWTGTKVNRSIAEGRSRLKVGMGRILSGEGCAAVGPAIDRLADGRADADDLVALRPHLRRCGACRVRLRRARGGHLAFVPAPLLALAPWVGGGHRAPRTRVGELVAERLAPVLPGVTGSATDAGLALGAGLATVMLGAGVVIGAGGGGDGDRPPVLLHGATTTMSVSARDLGRVAGERAAVPTAADRRADRAVDRALADPPTTALGRRAATPAPTPARSATTSTRSAPAAPAAASGAQGASGRGPSGPTSGAAAREFGFE